MTLQEWLQEHCNVCPGDSTEAYVLLAYSLHRLRLCVDALEAVRDNEEIASDFWHLSKATCDLARQVDAALADVED